MDNSKQTYVSHLPYLSSLTVFCGDVDLEEMANEVSKKFNVVHKICDITVDAVREVIKNCYTISYPMVYIFPHVEKMSLNAINSLLKITEEPPNRSVFILTVDDICNLISTIRSRAVIVNPIHKNIEFAKTLEDFCNIVYSNIGSVPLTNALKITNRIKLKETDEDKFELLDFLLCMRDIYVTNLKEYGRNDDLETANKLIAKFIETEIAIYQLKLVKGVKKDALIDEWIIKIRGVDTNEEKYSRNSNRTL